MTTKKLTFKKVISEFKERDEWKVERTYDGISYEVPLYRNVAEIINSVAFEFKKYDNLQVNNEDWSKTLVESRGRFKTIEELYWEAVK